MSDGEEIALRAIKARPGCSAWALSVLADSPPGMDSETFRYLLEHELQRLHAAGRIQATTYGVERVSYWPASYDVPDWAGDPVTPAEAAERDRA